jgi:hypothetical protein
MMSNALMPSCICCGKPLGGNRSKEHVIPVWLQQALDERYEDLTRCIAEGANEQVVEHRRHVFDKFQQGHFCEDCNCGWMNSLEGHTAPVLIPLMNGERNLLELSESDSFLISRWAVKTALVLSSVTMDVSVRDLAGLRQLRDMPGRLPDRWGVFVAVQPSRNRSFSYFDRHHWPSIPPEKAKVREVQMQAGALKISLQLRHLLLLAGYVPDFPFRFLLHAGLHIPLVARPGDQILHAYRQPIRLIAPSDPLNTLRVFHDTLGIVHI